MPPIHQNYSILLDLNASNASELFQPSNKQFSKQVRKPAIQQAIPFGGSGAPGARRAGAPAGERRRWFPKNSGIWAEPWSNVPRNQISRAGNPSLDLVQPTALFTQHFSGR